MEVYVIDSFRRMIDDLCDHHTVTEDILTEVIKTTDDEDINYLYQTARKVTDDVYGKDIYIRGLIEFSNYCKNDCLYCGIRRSNKSVQRYRLGEDEIISCADTGYRLGFRTIVLQSGEDPHFDDDTIIYIIKEIKKAHPDAAITLSIGEKERDSYEAYYKAGADRYLLRHESADKIHYDSMHPDDMSYDHRIGCLYDLRDIGYQVGCGFMVGSPGQSIHSLSEDFKLIRELRPHMVGIGPFISQKDTPFGDEPDGTLEMTRKLISLLRLTDPKLLLPATTALGTIDPKGREYGIISGANVIMPNLSPVSVRRKYLLYDGKICTGEEAAECIVCLKRRVELTGYEIVTDRGDHPDRKVD